MDITMNTVLYNVIPCIVVEYPED